MWSGFTGEGSKTIIPAHAHAKISCRLVPDMDPVRTFERVRDAILAVPTPGVRVDVSLLNTGMWSLTGVDHPATQAAARCLEEVFGQKPVLPARGRVHPRVRIVRVDPRPAGGAARLHQPRRPGARAQRVDGARQLRGRLPDRRALLGGARNPTPLIRTARGSVSSAGLQRRCGWYAWGGDVGGSEGCPRGAAAGSVAQKPTSRVDRRSHCEEP